MKFFPPGPKNGEIKNGFLLQNPSLLAALAGKKRAEAEDRKNERSFFPRISLSRRRFPRDAKERPKGGSVGKLQKVKWKDVLL